jgi:calcineurin-like phosphoesterase family protein
LIYGNHDNMIRQNKGLRERFASVQDVKEIKVTLADGTRQDIVMNHFAQRVWNKAHYGAWHLYGHSHGDLESEPYFKSMDVGIDARPLGDMCPWSLDEIAEIMATRPALGHHSM